MREKIFRETAGARTARACAEKTVGFSLDAVLRVREEVAAGLFVDEAVRKAVYVLKSEVEAEKEAKEKRLKSFEEEEDSENVIADGCESSA